LSWHIYQPEGEDADHILDLARRTPELNVGGIAGHFPDGATLLDSIEHRDNDVWLLAVDDDGTGVGFVCAKIDDVDVLAVASACVVYVAVDDVDRRTGIGRELWRELNKILRERGVQYVYAWAHPSNGAVKFFESIGFSEGSPCVFMDRRLEDAT
jgi:ribosomal protein S18 acetylase RimI-like enzyme